MRSWSLSVMVLVACAPPDTAGDAGDATSAATEESEPASCETLSPDFTAPPSSTLDGMSVSPSDPGVRIELPGQWIDWHASQGNNLQLSRDELEQARDGSGEWDTEYALVRFSGAEDFGSIVASACWDSHLGDCCGP